MELRRHLQRRKGRVTALTLFFGCLAFLLLASGDAWALGSTPVTVVNPATSPANTNNIDDPGRVAYQASSESPTCINVVCSFIFPAVPAGHRLVVQHMSGQMFFSATPGRLNATISALGIPAALSTFFVPFVGPFAAFDQPVQIYFDAGNSPDAGYVIVESNGQGGASTVTFAAITLSGYVLDCTAAPCTAIAP